MDQEKFKSRPSNSLFQIARGSGATLKTLEITKFVKTTVHTELFTQRRQERGKHSTDQEKDTWEHKVCQDNSPHRVVTQRRQEPGKHSTDQESLSRQQSVPSRLRGADKSQTNTQQIKKVWQDNDLHTPSGLYNTDESQSKQLLRENSDYLDNSFKE